MVPVTWIKKGAKLMTKENLIFVINYDDQTIKEMDHYDLCEFLNDMQSDKKLYKEKNISITPRKSIIFIIF